MSVRLNLEAFGTYNTTTNERKGTLYSTIEHPYFASLRRCVIPSLPQPTSSFKMTAIIPIPMGRIDQAAIVKQLLYDPYPNSFYFALENRPGNARTRS
jgi:hypothetical protein